MIVTLGLDCLQGLVNISLMGDTDLVGAFNRIVGELLPFADSNEMLRLDQWIA